MALDADLGAVLDDLSRQELLRERPTTGSLDLGLIDVCTNDYLGYAAERVSRETSEPGGAGASRLIHGTRPVHLALEAELAAWVGLDDALLFSSGYAANIGALAALAGPDDLIVSDELNHASIIDGCRLSRARISVVPHLDLDAIQVELRQSVPGRKWVVTESYFSMDADSPDLVRLRRVCDEAGAALFVDEAHALGVFGDQGEGLSRLAGARPDVLVGTLGKAVGLQGAFVAGSPNLVRFLWNRARSFVFSTAPSPALAAEALARVRRVRRDGGARRLLAERVNSLELALRSAGVPMGERRRGPIFPIVLGSPARALSAARALRAAGFLAQAIRPPTVPAGTSRLRVALRATLSPSDVSRLGAVLGEACAAR